MITTYLHHQRDPLATTRPSARLIARPTARPFARHRRTAALVAALAALAISAAGCTSSSSSTKSSSATSVAPTSPAATSMTGSKSSTASKSSTGMTGSPASTKSLTFKQMTKANVLALQKQVAHLHGVQNVVYYPDTKQFQVFLVKATAADIAKIKLAVHTQVMKK